MGGTPYIGDIMLFAGNFAPVNWAFCNGQLMSIAQNDALFNLIGTTYGGDGVQTFALPDLRGRVPVGVGPGFVQGQIAGEESHVLTVNEMPSHTHTTLNAQSLEGDSVSPGNALPAKAGAGDPRFGPTRGGPMHAASIGPGGGSQPHTNLMPSLCINYCIALFGIYPSQN